MFVGSDTAPTGARVVGRTAGGRLCFVVGLTMAGLVGLGGAGLALQPEDLFEMRSVSLEDLSRDGRFLLYTVHAYDRETGHPVQRLYRWDFASGEAVPLLAGKSYRAAVWRPDTEALALAIEEEAGCRLYLTDPLGGERRLISETPHEFEQLQWSPRGDAMAFLEETVVGTVGEVPEDVIVAEQIGYRHLDDGYRQGRLRQLFVIDVATGQTRRLLEQPLDVRALAWSPDGSQLVFEAKRRVDLGVNLNTDLWLVEAATGRLRQLTSNPGPDQNPQWTADGRIAYLRHADPLNESAAVVIARLDALELGDQGPVDLAATDFDNRIGRIFAGGRYFTGFVHGCIDLYELRDGGYHPLTGGGRDFWDAKIAGGRAVLAGADMMTPSALYVLELDDPRAGELDILIDPNADWAARVKLYQPQPFSAPVDGREIEGWCFLPEERAADGKAPTVLSIHGGPEWMYGGYFLPEFHVLPEHGYAVLIANPAGSTGYGMAFQVAVRGDWVGQPARDVLGLLDAAIAAGWADPDRLAVMGGSYGGHLTVALTTQTDRFKAAAADRLTCDLVSMWGTTDEKWFPEWEFLGRPWEPQAQPIYLKNSPITNVDRVRTPTLVSHGLLDYRCLISQAEFWFSALKASGVPVRFLRFGNEGHGLRGRENQVFYQKELLAWFDRYVLAPAD
jgi:dipeptidyl aminopeptidase/acylaminoacyl peptidase